MTKLRIYVEEEAARALGISPDGIVLNTSAESFEKGFHTGSSFPYWDDGTRRIGIPFSRVLGWKETKGQSVEEEEGE